MSRTVGLIFPIEKEEIKEVVKPLKEEVVEETKTVKGKKDKA